MLPGHNVLNYNPVMQMDRLFTIGSPVGTSRFSRTWWRLSGGCDSARRKEVEQGVFAAGVALVMVLGSFLAVSRMDGDEPSIAESVVTEAQIYGGTPPRLGPTIFADSSTKN